jgi:hypothetical protein
MASIKDLKKDINFLTEEVVGTCYMHYHIQNPDDKKKQELDNIADDMIKLRNDVINKINNPKEEKPNKKYFQGLFNEVLEHVNNSFERLNKLNSL